MLIKFAYLDFLRKSHPQIQKHKHYQSFLVSKEIDH